MVLLVAVGGGFAGVVDGFGEMVEVFCEASSVSPHVLGLEAEGDTGVVISVGSSVTVWGREVVFGFLSVSSCLIRLRFACSGERRGAWVGSVSLMCLFFQVNLFSSVYCGGAGAMVGGGTPYSHCWRAGMSHIVV